MTWMPDYTDIATVRTYIRGGLDADNDAFIASWITATSRNVDDYCGRQFGNTGTTQARLYDPVFDAHLQQYIYELDDIQNITGMTVTAGAIPVTTYTLWPRNNPAKGLPYTQLRTASNLAGFFGGVFPAPPSLGTITVTAIFGWTTVPAAVPIGVLLQAARLAKRRDSPFGIAGSPAEGSELRLLAQLDPDFRTTLKPFLRDWWAA
jgi:hypothetical protein